MLSTRRILLGLVIGAAILVFVSSDISYTYSRTPAHKSIPPGRPFRPPYLPFHPPSLEKFPDSHRLDDPSTPHLLWTSRALSIKEAFLRAYHSFEEYAPFPADELRPLSNGSVENFNGWGVTMVDALDTILLLGLEDEFQRALSHVASIDFAMPVGHHAPFFETIIRYLGGFLSAYALSNEPILLSRAEDLATRLLPAFDTTSGLPTYGVNTESKQQSGGITMYFAEIASCQMEYKYLAHLTGRAEFFTKVDSIMNLLKDSQQSHGMWPTLFGISHGKPMSSQYSVGAFADSAYEYLLKQYLLSGKTEHRLAEMYMKSMTGILENLVYLSRTRNLLYITDTNGLVPTRKFEHLSCFFPGLLALGADTLPESVMSKHQRDLHMWAAEGLAHTCWVMYMDQPSGLGPEIVLFEGWGENEGPTWPQQPNEDWKKERWMVHVEKWEKSGREGGKPPGVGNAGMPVKSSEGARMDYTLYDSRYLLRPETLESMLVLYRTTKDTKWREHGWQIWEAIESKTRTFSGYTSVRGVEEDSPTLEDSMPSYFLAETVKYAYLLALDEDPWPLDSYVLNTEAHPFPVFSWRDWERQRFGIPEK